MTWSVYGLIDPATSEVFYVGCSSNVPRRLHNHNSDPASSAWSRCVDIRERGEKVVVCFFARDLPKTEARIIEARLTLSIPGLDNSKAGHILPLVDFERGWLDLSPEIQRRAPPTIMSNAE